MDSITRKNEAENGKVAEPKPKHRCYYGLATNHQCEWPGRFWVHETPGDFEGKFDTAWLAAALRSSGFNHVVEQLYMAEPDELAMGRIRDLMDVLYGLGDPLADLLVRSVDEQN